MFRFEKGKINNVKHYCALCGKDFDNQVDAIFCCKEKVYDKIINNFLNNTKYYGLDFSLSVEAAITDFIQNAEYPENIPDEHVNAFIEKTVEDFKAYL